MELRKRKSLKSNDDSRKIKSNSDTNESNIEELNGVKELESLVVDEKDNAENHDDIDEEIDAICNKTLENLNYLFEKPNNNSFELLNNILLKEEIELNDKQLKSKSVVKESHFDKLIKSSDIYSKAPIIDSVTNKKVKKDKTSLGKGWFNFQPLELTDKIKRDIKLLELRNYIDPKRFYKNPDKTNRFVHVGTVIEGRHEFKSSRLNKKDRRQSLVDEYLHDSSLNQYNKKIFMNIQDVKSKKIKIFPKKRKISK